MRLLGFFFLSKSSIKRRVSPWEQTFSAEHFAHQLTQKAEKKPERKKIAIRCRRKAWRRRFTRNIRSKAVLLCNYFPFGLLCGRSPRGANSRDLPQCYINE